MNKHLKRGFTLVEMMIVVAIIAVLAGVALPQYTKYVKKSETVEGINFMRQIADAEVLYKSTHTAFLAFNTKTGTDEATKLQKELFVTIPTNAKFRNYKVEICTASNAGTTSPEKGIMVSSWIGTAGDAAADPTSIFMTYPKRSVGSIFIENYVNGTSVSTNVPECE